MLRAEILANVNPLLALSCTRRIKIAQEMLCFSSFACYRATRLYLPHSCPAVRHHLTFPQTQEHLLTEQNGHLTFGIFTLAPLGFQL